MKRLELNPAEAEMVKKIFQMYNSGSSTVAIAKEMFQTGVRSREGHKFYPKLIGDILKNKVYLGTFVSNRKHYSKKLKIKPGKGYRYLPNDPSEVIEVPNTHEAIITKKEFDMAQAKLARNRKTAVIRSKIMFITCPGFYYVVKNAVRLTGGIC